MGRLFSRRLFCLIHYNFYNSQNIDFGFLVSSWLQEPITCMTINRTSAKLNDIFKELMEHRRATVDKQIEP